MIPLRDNVPSATTPVVTYTLMAVNLLVFFHEVSLKPAGLDAFFSKYALTAFEVTTGNSVSSELPQFVAEFRAEAARNNVRIDPKADWLDIARSQAFERWLRKRYDRAPDDMLPKPISATERFLPFLTSMFLHAGWMHLIGNMWFLWIFGDNVEDNLGHGRYVAFYLVAGLAGGLLQIFADDLSPIPSVGASGAIAGVMGAYMLMLPQARVLTLIPLGVFTTFVEIPAVYFLGVWILLQLGQGAASLSPSTDSGGVAWFAHIGGFAAGAVWALAIPKARTEHSWIDHHRPRFRSMK